MKLHNSFSELEQAIASAKAIMGGGGRVHDRRAQDSFIMRIESYEDILQKQRALASELQIHIEAENWMEAARCIRLINGLSGMIRDDAREIATELDSPVRITHERELTLS